MIYDHDLEMNSSTFELTFLHDFYLVIRKILVFVPFISRNRM